MGDEPTERRLTSALTYCWRAGPCKPQWRPSAARAGLGPGMRRCNPLSLNDTVQIIERRAGVPHVTVVVAAAVPCLSRATASYSPQVEVFVAWQHPCKFNACSRLIKTYAPSPHDRHRFVPAQPRYFQLSAPRQCDRGHLGVPGRAPKGKVTSRLPALALPMRNARV